MPLAGGWDGIGKVAPNMMKQRIPLLFANEIIIMAITK